MKNDTFLPVRSMLYVIKASELKCPEPFTKCAFCESSEFCGYLSQCYRSIQRICDKKGALKAVLTNHSTDDHIVVDYNDLKKRIRNILECNLPMLAVEYIDLITDSLMTTIRDELGGK